MDRIHNNRVGYFKPDYEDKLYAPDYLDGSYQHHNLAYLGIVPGKIITGETYGLA